MSNKLHLVTVNIVVLNGEKYINHCLNTVFTQTYPKNKIEINVLDNGSTDKTKKIIKDFKSRISDLGFAKFSLYEMNKNLGMWPGQEKALEFSNGKYILALSSDVLLEQDFIEEAIKILEKDPKIGAVEPKILRFRLDNDKIIKTNIIDTLGFEILKSRRVINIGHGEIDKRQFNEQKEIFAAEGAAPIFRRKALEDCRINGKIIDPDMFWYGDDFDLGWRMRLFGWKQIYDPKVTAYHDRQTTHTLRKTWRDFINIRKKIPKFKRKLDYRNTRITFLKNDYPSIFIKNLPHFLKREILLWGYFLIYEPFMLTEIFNILKLMPKTIEKRRKIMKKASVSPEEISRWFL